MAQKDINSKDRMYAKAGYQGWTASEDYRRHCQPAQADINRRATYGMPVYAPCDVSPQYHEAVMQELEAHDEINICFVYHRTVMVQATNGTSRKDLTGIIRNVIAENFFE